MKVKFKKPLIEEALTFDDVLLIPQFSEVLPTDVLTDSFVTKKLKLKTPILSSAMDTVTESEMCIAMALGGGLGVLHKNMAKEVQAQEVMKVKSFNNLNLKVAAAMGVTAQEKDRAKILVEAGVDLLVIDTAHGHSKGVIEAVKEIKKLYKNKVEIIAGNVATPEACLALIKAGVDGVKIGIGPGSICTTRVVAGIGVPQLYALLSCKDVCHQYKIPYIADGGIKYSGDIVKAMASGASAVMVGSLLAGTLESPGEVFEVNGKKYKSYRGMGSLGAMEKGSKDRYGQASVSEAKKLVPEGVEGIVVYKGAVENVLFQLAGGLRAGMGYLGAKDIKDLWKKAKFIKITDASLKESHPHDIYITKDAPNYKE